MGFCTFSVTVEFVSKILKGNDKKKKEWSTQLNQSNPEGKESTILQKKSTFKNPKIWEGQKIFVILLLHGANMLAKINRKITKPC